MKYEAEEQESYLTFECMNTVGGWCGGSGLSGGITKKKEKKRVEEVCCKRSS